MAKRMKQASLLDTFSLRPRKSPKLSTEERSQDEEVPEFSLEFHGDISDHEEMNSDPPDNGSSPAVEIEGMGEVSCLEPAATKCSEVCCSSNLKPYQPDNPDILKSLARGG